MRTPESSQTLNTAALFSALVVFAALSRFLGIAPNFAAVSGVALFAGYIFRSRLLAAAVPVTAMLLSDLFIGGYQPLVMIAVYLCTILPVLAKPILGVRPAFARVFVAAVGCSVIFFLVTNFAVWGAGGLAYAKTLSGLVDCYAAGLPFFRASLAGDLGFACLLFGVHALATRSSMKPAAVPVPIPAV